MKMCMIAGLRTNDVSRCSCQIGTVENVGLQGTVWPSPFVALMMEARL
jgi:hypothetical protein